ncbi:MAG: S41 family peptidase [Muribaculaceae bacterium]|nr:S41 family peptidase [Muribaculaceae bacterium]
MNHLKKTNVWLPLLLAVAFIVGFLSSALLHRGGAPSATQKKFQTVMNLIKNDYVDEVDLDSLLEHTLPSLLTNLDPHSAYIPASELQAANEELDGAFSGIGIQFMLNNDTITVLEVISGGPSEKVGILPGDRITRVDGKNVAGVGITNEQVLRMLRGDRGSKVSLSLKRPSSKKTLTYEVTRGDIPVTSIDAAYMLDDATGFIRVNKFGRTTYDEFWQALNDLKNEGAKDYIIDLRGNTGGYMEIAFMMVNEFLEKGEVIVSTKGRDYYSTSTVRADGTGSFRDARLAVLIDEYSASASEIFAGAIQDNDRGLVIGRRSFGKGLIQRQSVLPDSSAIRLTIGRYYTPSGRCIQKDYSNLSAYEHDIIDRYNRGEMFSADSMKINKNLAFKTVHGRTVYGGGGIMPDIFMPNDTSGISSYYITVANAGLFQKFAFDYVDVNRSVFARAKDLNTLLDMLPDDESLLREFVGYCVDNGVPARWYYINISRDLIVNQVKALIARDVLDYNAYFTVSNRIDPSVRRALEEFKKGTADFPLSLKPRQPKPPMK